MDKIKKTLKSSIPANNRADGGGFKAGKLNNLQKLVDAAPLSRKRDQFGQQQDSEQLVKKVKLVGQDGGLKKPASSLSNSARKPHRQAMTAWQKVYSVAYAYSFFT